MSTETAVTERTSLTLPDQREFWDRWHNCHSVASHQDHAISTLQSFLGALPATTPPRLLEIGCGQGREAAALAEAGFNVHAFDHSHVAINVADESSKRMNLGISYSIHDTKDPFNYPDMHFIGVFSHLALHYFTKEETHSIFNEISRVLIPGGILTFTVRSVRDPLFGGGDPIGRNMFCHKGHIRHFFDEVFLAELLAGWEVQSVDHYDTSDRTINPGMFFKVVAGKHR